MDLGNLKQEVDGAVNAATSIADLADKFAVLAKKYGGLVPGAGPEIVAVAGLIDGADKLLHSIKNLLG